jgi:hypothetical protein
VVLGSLSAGAAFIHFAVAPEHFREDFRFGLFFMVVATLQLAWGAAILSGESRTLYSGAAVGNALVLTVWAVSRTTGVPFGPNPWTPEGIALLDGVATAYEAVIVAGSLYLLGEGSAIRQPSAAVKPRPRSAIIVYVLPALTFFLGSSHDHGLGLVPRLDLHLGHHLFHLVFFGGASLIFALYVAFLVWENGWPKFSWRLDPHALERR